MDEQTLDVLATYTVRALRVCSTWTHSDVLLALSTVVYGNGPQCHKVRIYIYLFKHTVRNCLFLIVEC